MPPPVEFTIVETADGSRTLRSPQDGQTFASVHGALTEAEHVYLQGSRVAERMATGQATRVLEVGFGTGLNFLVTARAAIEAQTPLHYTAIEARPVPLAVLERLDHATLPGMESMTQALHDALSSPDGLAVATEVLPGIHLRLLVSDARTHVWPPDSVDAIYHDPFSPDVNPELWAEPVLGRLFETLRPGGRLATYCVKGSVRRALQAVGFDVQRRPGPPGKREVLAAQRPSSATE